LREPRQLRSVERAGTRVTGKLAHAVTSKRQWSGNPAAQCRPRRQFGQAEKRLSDGIGVERLRVRKPCPDMRSNRCCTERKHVLRCLISGDEIEHRRMLRTLPGTKDRQRHRTPVCN
jgi:hypothetical protein